MSDNEDQAPKRELTPMERLIGLEKVKKHSTMINTAYSVFVSPAVWFRENVSVMFVMFISCKLKKNIFGRYTVSHYLLQ